MNTGTLGNRMRYLCIALFLLFRPALSFASLDTLRGEINIYTPVLAIDYCHSAVIVQSSKGFSAGDKVLIIQMKGATVKTADSSTFGDVVSYNDAGNFELGTIAWVDGTSIFLQKKLLRNYAIAGHVQLIRVPMHVNAIIDGVVSAKPWNGSIGGVVALIVTDTLRMKGIASTITATVAGFRGGEISVMDTSFISQMPYRFSTSSHKGRRKGEGIVEYDSAYDRGRGHFANGGGGSNAFGAGGGGGGNGASGGTGGSQYRHYGDSSIGGKGGVMLSYDTTTNKIFLGGGGGGAQRSHNGALRGASGGGIILVQAGTFIGNGGFFEALGDGFVSGYIEQSMNDGAGGAGAGGTIILDIAHWPVGTDYGINAMGGSGYNANSQPSVDSLSCYGPGGGGAGGVVWVRDTISLGMSASRTVDVSGGLAGTVVNTASSCNGQPYGAGSGDAGLILEHVHIPEGTEPR